MLYIKFINRVILVLIFCCFINNNFAQADKSSIESKYEKGAEIIRLSKKEIDKKLVLDNLKTLSVIINDTTYYSRGEVNDTYTLYLEMPNKLKKVLGKTDNDSMKLISIWNGQEYFEDTEFTANNTIHSLNKEEKKVTSEVENKANTSAKAIFPNVKQLPKDERLILIGWYRIFPILLSNPFDKEAKFEYIGKAESESQRADIIDVKVSDLKKIRFFFDEKTHLLLMMTVTTNSDNGYTEEKYFYSKYELLNGLLICKKVLRENFFTKKGNSNPIKSTSDIVIEELKINPDFSKNTFKTN